MIISLTLRHSAIVTIPGSVCNRTFSYVCVSISVHCSPVMLEQTHRQHREGQVCPLQAEEMVSQVEEARAFPESSKLDMPLRWEQWYVHVLAKFYGLWNVEQWTCIMICLPRCLSRLRVCVHKLANIAFPAKQKATRILQQPVATGAIILGQHYVCCSIQSSDNR